MIRADEGCEFEAYPDPNSELGMACAKARLPMRDYRQVEGWSTKSADPWTIGYGQTGGDVRSDTVWTQAQADGALAVAVRSLDARLAGNITDYLSMNAVRRACLIDIAYNVGVTGLLAFHRMLGYLAQGNMSGAASELLDSAAARELPARYQRLADRLRSGAMT